MLVLTEEEKKEILEGLPDIKFSYEQTTHKTISADLYFIIPKGKKYIAWFTHYNRKNICLLLELGYKKKVINIFCKYVSFDDSLCYGTYGTILYGTVFYANKEIENLNNHQYFCIENIHYYKGDYIDHYNVSKKLDLIKYIFTYKLSQTSFLTNGVVFGLPAIYSSYREANEIIKNNILPYNIYSIQYRTLYQKTNEFYYVPTIELNNTKNKDNTSINKNINNNNTFVNKNSQFKIFIVTPDIQNDIYYLKYENYNRFENNDNKLLLAHIPDYKTSVMMNKIFRKIKENDNLDFLEESDDEDEFENINIDKFVDLNKSVKMKCFFNNKFKRWTPFEIL